MSIPNRPPATYADAGVSIEAGNLLVKMIAPLVRATRRPGADAEIGGFGGIFDLKAAGFTDPLLVAATDGVGTKLRIGIDTGAYATGRLTALGLEGTRRWLIEAQDKDGVVTTTQRSI